MVLCPWCQEGPLLSLTHVQGKVHSPDTPRLACSRGSAAWPATRLGEPCWRSFPSISRLQSVVFWVFSSSEHIFSHFKWEPSVDQEQSALPRGLSCRATWGARRRAVSFKQLNCNFFLENVCPFQDKNFTGACCLPGSAPSSSWVRSQPARPTALWALQLFAYEP